MNADRASLFLVDSKSNELYASIFDVGNKNATDGLDTFIEASEIRCENATVGVSFILQNILAHYTNQTVNFVKHHDHGREVTMKTGSVH